MKKIILVIVVMCMLSCSNKLTNSKAEKVINSCLKSEKTRYVGVGFFQEGKATEIASNSSFYKYYKKLENDGYIEMKSLGKNYYKIFLTEKGEGYSLGGDNIRIYQFRVSEITEIHEQTDKNIAKVKGKFEKINKTPFYNEDIHEAPADKSNFKPFSVTLRKTNDGWKLCD